METKVRKADPLTLIPPIPLLEVARHERVSGDCVRGAAKRLGLPIDNSPTGRKTIAAPDVVRIVEHIRSRASKS